LDIVIAIAIGLILISLAISPSLLAWSAVSLWLPKWYKLPPVKMTIFCFFLSVVTVMVLNVELESGILSIPSTVFLLCLAWLLVLIPASIAFRYSQYKKFTASGVKH